MASLSTDRQGNRRILYFAPDARKRRTLYIGKMKQTAATASAHFSEAWQFGLRHRLIHGTSFSEHPLKGFTEDGP